MTSRMKAPKFTRGERNNNPGNIVASDIKWLGETKSFDPKFETFKTPYQGIRALAVLLRTYYYKRRLRTVEAIILRYAPETENDSRAYINFVSAQMGLDPIDPLMFRHDLRGLLRAIIRYENGRILRDYEPLIDRVVEEIQ